MEGLFHYISLLGSYCSYICCSFVPSLECMSHQKSSLVFLWVVVVKAILFRGLLIINATRKVVAVVAAFSKIFLRSHHPWMFMIYIFIIGDSWKVIIIVRTCIWYVFIVSEETFLIGPSSHMHFAHWVLGLKHSLPFTRPLTAQFSVEAQCPIRDLGP